MMRITAIAHGRVQGVGYRYYVISCAEKTHVSGYVKNLPDATVQVVAEGEEEVLDDFCRLIRAEGTPSIGVEKLIVTRGEATGEFKNFSVRW
jgi:acylphosphatase